MFQWISYRSLLLSLSLAVVVGANDVSTVNGQESPRRGKNADTSQIDVIIEEAEAAELHVPDSLTMRVRIVQLKPFEPTQIQYKYGGWGSPGDRVYGYFFKPKRDPAKITATEKLDDLLDGVDPTKKAEKPEPKFDGLKGGRTVDPRVRNIVEKPPLFELREWSQHVPLKLVLRTIPG